LFRILDNGQQRSGLMSVLPGNSSPSFFDADARPDSHEAEMMRLETPRLTIIALTVQQMRWQRDDFARLEQALGLAASGQQLEDELRPIVSRAISNMRRRPYHVHWHCQWAAVLKEESRIIGSLAFKGPPDRDNAVEIGYGFDPFYHNRGLATDAVAEMVRWALAEDGVDAVIAETANRNVASMRVLQKVGFVITSATDRFLYWKVSF
jgi:RimJ/RimL family protein N-acetyltransferase